MRDGLKIEAVYLPQKRGVELKTERDLALFLGNGSLSLATQESLENLESPTDLQAGQIAYLTKREAKEGVYLTAATKPAFLLVAEHEETRARLAKREETPKDFVIGKAHSYQKTDSLRNVQIKSGRLGPLETQVAQVNLITLMPSQEAGNHLHKIKWEIIGLVSGELRIAIGSPSGVRTYDLTDGDIAFLPVNYAHAIRNKSQNAPAYYFEATNLAFDPKLPRFDVEPLEIPLMPFTQQ